MIFMNLYALGQMRLFFIQRNLTWLSSPGNLQCVCAVLAQLNALLATSLRSALDARWKVILSFVPNNHHVVEVRFII